MAKACRLACVLAISVAAPSLDGVGKQVAIQREDLLGVWVGLTEDDLEMVRLDLSPQGTGVVGYVFVDEKPCVLLLKSWQYDRGNLDLDLPESSECGRDREYLGVVSGNTLVLTARSAGWKRRAVLKREAPLVTRWENLKTAMASATTDRGG